MGAAFRRFCAHFCCCCCCADDEPEEKNPLLRYWWFPYNPRSMVRDQETNLWSEPGDHSHSERDDDRELYNLLQKRSRMRRVISSCHKSRNTVLGNHKLWIFMNIYIVQIQNVK
uniref:Uncharacterized protein n=1 Tax=Paramormyrops kingsleyae TaxID=1676925 RepID=A0A3B3Q612_9TELE